MQASFRQNGKSESKRILWEWKKRKKSIPFIKIKVISAFFVSAVVDVVSALSIFIQSHPIWEIQFDSTADKEERKEKYSKFFGYSMRKNKLEGEGFWPRPIKTKVFLMVFKNE